MIKTVTVEVVNKLGLHARPAGKLTQLASRFDSTIDIQRDDQQVNAKSILGVMMLAAGKGVELQIRAEGEDAEQALEAIQALFKGGFGEE